MFHQVIASIHVLFYIIETCFQLDLCFTHFQLPRADLVYFYALLFIIITALLLINVLSLAWVHQRMDFLDGREGLVTCMVFHVLCLGPLWRYFKIIFSGDRDDVQELTKLRLIQVVLQNTSFIILHIITLWHHRHVTAMSGVTLMFSFLSLTFCYTLCEYYNADAAVNGRSLGAHVRCILPRFVLHFFFVSSRLVSILLFSYMYNLWILLVLCIHYFVCIAARGLAHHLCCVDMPNIIFSARTMQAHASHDITLFSEKICTLNLLVDIIDVLGGNDRLLFVFLHYCLLLTENSIMCMTWYIRVMECKPTLCDRGSAAWILVIVVYGTFIAGSIIVTISHMQIKKISHISSLDNNSFMYTGDTNNNVSYVNELSCYFNENAQTEVLPSIRNDNHDPNSVDHISSQLVQLDTISNTLNISDVSSVPTNCREHQVQANYRACQSHDSGYQTPPVTLQPVVYQISSQHTSSDGVESHKYLICPSVKSVLNDIQHANPSTDLRDSFSNVTSMSCSSVSNKPAVEITSVQVVDADHLPQIIPHQVIHIFSDHDSQTETTNNTSSSCECCRNKPISNLWKTRQMSEWTSDSNISGSLTYTESSNSSCWSYTTCTNTWPQGTSVCSYNLKDLPREVSIDENVSTWLSGVNRATMSFTSDEYSSDVTSVAHYPDIFLSKKKNNSKAYDSEANVIAIKCRTRAKIGRVRTVSLDNLCRSVGSAIKKTRHRKDMSILKTNNSTPQSQQSIRKNMFNKWKV